MYDVRYRYKSFSGIAIISMTWKFWGMGSLRDRVSEGTESLTWSRQLSTFYTVVQTSLLYVPHTVATGR